MADTAEVRIDSRQAVASVNKVGNAADKAQGQLNKLGGAANKTQGAFGKLKSAGSSLQGVLAGLGAGAALKGLINAGVQSERTTKRMKVLTDQFGEYKQLSEFAAQAAEKFTVGNASAANAVTDLYGRLRPAGVSLEDIKQTFNGVSVAAAQVGLSAADTDGVLLQLSQARGSGTLQGDEFRSVMERLPAVGQAIAKSLGVSVGELKQLGADGKLTTDVIIKGLEELAGQEPPPADAYKKFAKASEDLAESLGKNLLPLFTPLVEGAVFLLEAFGNLPGPVQAIIAGVVGIAGAIVVVVPLVAAIASGFQAFAALGIGATIAGWLPAITGLGTAISGILPIITGIISGPVGWVALLAGAGVAIYAFRDEIGAALSGIAEFFAPVIEGFMGLFVDPLIEAGGAIIDFFTDNWTQIVDSITQPFRQAWDFINNTFLEPIGEAIESVKETILSTWSDLQQGLISPFEAAAEIIKGVLNSVLSLVGSVLNGYIDAINTMIGGVNKITGAIGIAAIPLIPNVEVPQFAKGGMVNGAQLAVVGEAGPEYIVPEGKAQGFAENILAGVRGPNAIPAYAEGGYIGPVNISTGPVMQQGGTNYVTMEQFTAGVQDVISAVTLNARSYGTRRFSGIS